MGGSHQNFYLLDTGDHECGIDVYVVSGRDITKDDVRNVIYEHPDFFGGDAELVQDSPGRNLEEVVAVLLEGESDWDSQNWSYAVEVKEKGPITDDQIELLERFTGREVIRLE
jgi:hypothetical protein